jgi:hypothetical protein
MLSRRLTSDAELFQAIAHRRASAAAARHGATVTAAHIDAPDLRGSRGGLGTLVRMWQAFLSRCRRMGLFD